MNCIDVLDAISDTMRRSGARLSHNQRMVLAGCLAVWLDKYAEQQHDELLACLQPFIKVGMELEKCNNNSNSHDSVKVWGVNSAWLTLGDFRALAKAGGE